MEVSGKIELGGTATDFLLTTDGGYVQGGAGLEALGDRVELLEVLGNAYRDWCEENLCRECEDALLNNGEGYDGKCGNCADRAEKDGEDE